MGSAPRPPGSEANTGADETGRPAITARAASTSEPPPASAAATAGIVARTDSASARPA